VHADAIPLGVQFASRQMNASADVQMAIERVPLLGAIEIETRSLYGRLWAITSRSAGPKKRSFDRLTRP